MFKKLFSRSNRVDEIKNEIEEVKALVALKDEHQAEYLERLISLRNQLIEAA